MAVDVPQAWRRHAWHADGSVLAAYTAYSLADKPALTPGFAAGLAANMIGSGFLGPSQAG